VQLTLTPKGRELLASLAPDQAQVNDLIFQNLSAHEFTEPAAVARQAGIRSERGIALLEYILGDRELRAAG